MVRTLHRKYSSLHTNDSFLRSEPFRRRIPFHLAFQLKNKLFLKLPPYAGRTAIANRIQPPTSEGIHLVPNLGQPVTQTAIRGRREGARTDRRCGGVDPRKLHGRSRQQGGRRRCLQESLRGDHLRRGPPIQGSPVEV